MDNHLIRWNTGRLIVPELDKLKFFAGYKDINFDLYNLWKEVHTYAKKNFIDVQSKYARNFGFEKEAYDDWVMYLDKVFEFQRYVEEHKDSDNGAISKKAKEVFDNKDVGQAYIADLQIIKKLELLLEYSSPVRDLFNFIVPLYKPESHKMTPELEEQIKEILDNKSLSGFEVPADLEIVDENTKLS